jgi:hypothetical protein
MFQFLCRTDSLKFKYFFYKINFQIVKLRKLLIYLNFKFNSTFLDHMNSDNGKEATVNRALDGSTYPG